MPYSVQAPANIPADSTDVLLREKQRLAEWQAADAAEGQRLVERLQRLSHSFTAAMEDLAAGLLEMAEQLAAIAQPPEPIPIPVRVQARGRR